MHFRPSPDRVGFATVQLKVTRDPSRSCSWLWLLGVGDSWFRFSYVYNADGKVDVETEPIIA